MGIGTVAGAMMAADEMDMLRERMEHLSLEAALADPQIRASYFGDETSYKWKRADGHRLFSLETFELSARALSEVLRGDGGRADELRAWLPTPQELIYTAEHEWWLSSCMIGAAHPALLCAKLYGERLEAWAQVEEIVQGVLAIEAWRMDPLARIEAMRLLARCHAARKEMPLATEALEAAALEAKAVGNVWMEAVVLRDMLGWAAHAQADSEPVRARLAAVEAGFRM